MNCSPKAFRRTHMEGVLCMLDWSIQALTLFMIQCPYPHGAIAWRAAISRRDCGAREEIHCMVSL